MTRRWSLAAAFLLTVVCGFLIVSFGSSSGVFAWADRGGQSTGAIQTQPGGSSAPAGDVTITDPSIPVDYGAAPSSAPRDDGASGEHRDDGGDRSGDSGHDEGGDRD